MRQEGLDQLKLRNVVELIISSEIEFIWQLILTIVTIVILLFYLICQCSVTDLSYIMYNDLQRRIKSSQIKS
jgi:hypothetical protein